MLIYQFSDKSTSSFLYTFYKYITVILISYNTNRIKANYITNSIRDCLFLNEVVTTKSSNSSKIKLIR